MVQDARLRFVYYCSGHGYGHATRVSAVACHLLSLKPQPIVHIVSSAPQHVFADSIAIGALYRNADIDPVIVQPVAYRVDRRKSVEVLRNFLKHKDHKIAEEVEWLRRVNADCVLSDAAFLGCSAANAVGIPSVLITNFTFDSVYSYLSTSSVDQDYDILVQPSADVLQAFFSHNGLPGSDVPIPEKELKPLVEVILDGYRCADLLLRLPGAIPIPSFSRSPSLPSSQWVDPRSKIFRPEVSSHLIGSPQTYKAHPRKLFPPGHRLKPTSISRGVISAPLIVRPPDPAVYTLEGRKQILDSIGVPLHLRDPNVTKILLVSFGGQVFHKPHSRSHSRSNSRSPSNAMSPNNPMPTGKGTQQAVSKSSNNIGFSTNGATAPGVADAQADTALHVQALSNALQTLSLNMSPRTAAPQDMTVITQGSAAHSRMPSTHSRARAQSQLVVSGAPPASIPTSPTLPNFSQATFTTLTIPPSPNPRPELNVWLDDEVEVDPEDIPQLFPDDSWIAIVCGVSKEWAREDGEELPDNFFVAPKDVYMPDLTAVADVLLGKLGYGTVSECVDACTPFVFVPRPLFIEEFGLRLLLEQEGVGVELSRASYESGEWANAVEEAWNKGRDRKAKKRLEGETGQRKEEGREMAGVIVDWVHRWKKAE